MKLYYKIALFVFIVALALLAFPGRAQAKPVYDDKVVFGDTYTLGSGETLSGNLAVLGGAVTLEKSSTITGGVSLLGGAVDADGTIDGNITILGGSLSLGDDAVVNGNIQTFGGTLRRSSKAQVLGQVVNGGVNPFQLNVPSLPARPAPWLDLTPIRTVFGGLASALFMAALAMLVALFWPKPTIRVAQAMVTQPAAAGGLGCLTFIVTPPLILLLLVTIILIPVSILAIILLAIAITFGWIALGAEIGRRISQAFQVDWHPAANAGLGTLLLTLIVSWASLIPFIGWLFSWLTPLLIVIIGLGGVILTRFGTQLYPATALTSGPFPPSPTPPARPQPPAPVMPGEPQRQAPVPTEPPVSDTPRVAPDLSPTVTASDAVIPDLNPSTTASDAVDPGTSPADGTVSGQEPDQTGMDRPASES